MREFLRDVFVKGGPDSYPSDRPANPSLPTRHRTVDPQTPLPAAREGDRVELQ